MKRFALVVALSMALACGGGGGGIVETGPVVAEYDCHKRVYIPGDIYEPFAVHFAVQDFAAGWFNGQVDVVHAGVELAKGACSTISPNCRASDWEFRLIREGEDAQFAKVTYFGSGRQSGWETLIPCSLETPNL